MTEPDNASELRATMEQNKKCDCCRLTPQGSSTAGTAARDTKPFHVFVALDRNGVSNAIRLNIIHSISFAKWPLASKLRLT